MKTAFRAACVFFASWIACTLLTAGAQQASVFRWNLPAWAAPPIVPPDNPMSVEKVALGRYLFYDKRFSYNEKLSCASCHLQRFGFTDLSPIAFGSTGERHPRRVKSLTNAGYDTALTWANPKMLRLEAQMLTPMFGEHPVELGFGGRQAELLERLRADARYPSLFKAAFPDTPDPITLDDVTKAIATFERTFVSLSSPYDRYRYGGDGGAIDESAKRGESLFFSQRLSCSHCHAGIDFSDNAADARTGPITVTLHNTGLYNIDGHYPAGNPGARENTGDPHDDGAFVTPTLRNVAVRAPYMHDGSVTSLNAVLDHYAAGGRTIVGTPLAGVGSLNPNKDPLIKGFALTTQERRDLIAFLESLTDKAFLTDPALSDPNPAVPVTAPTK